MKKDFNIERNGANYIIRNVPYDIIDTEDEEVISIGDSMKVTLILQLMEENEIPLDVDFNDVADLNFEEDK